MDKKTLNNIIRIQTRLAKTLELAQQLHNTLADRIKSVVENGPTAKVDTTRNAPVKTASKTNTNAKRNSIDYGKSIVEATRAATKKTTVKAKATTPVKAKAPVKTKVKAQDPIEAPKRLQRTKTKSK